MSKDRKKRKVNTVFSAYVLKILIFLAISLGLTAVLICALMPIGTKLVNMVESGLPMEIGDISISEGELKPLSDKGNIPKIENIPYGKQIANIQCNEIKLDAPCYFGANRASMRNGVGLSGEYTLFGENGVTLVTGYEQDTFKDLCKLEKGSKITAFCKYGEYSYTVYDKSYKPEKDNFVTNNSGDNLILCAICSDFSEHGGERLYVYAKCEGEV